MFLGRCWLEEVIVNPVVLRQGAECLRIGPRLLWGCVLRQACLDVLGGSELVDLGVRSDQTFRIVNRWR